VELLALVAGWILTIFVGVAGALVLWKMFRGDISLNKLISEPNGDASLSRFQFLIFTFIIAMGLFVVTLRQTPPILPDIPLNILGLLGISAGSYVVAKGLQIQRDTSLEQTKSDASVKMAAVQAGVPAPDAAANGTVIVVPQPTLPK
jgi:hypothetical protein